MRVGAQVCKLGTAGGGRTRAQHAIPLDRVKVKVRVRVSVRVRVRVRVRAA